jgi:hypothetical protein
VHRATLATFFAFLASFPRISKQLHRSNVGALAFFFAYSNFHIVGVDAFCLLGVHLAAGGAPAPPGYAYGVAANQTVMRQKNVFNFFYCWVNYLVM